MPKDIATKARVAREFISIKHMSAIERASTKGNFAISFRSAGVATIKALENGAAAKGHNILEKTIKESSLAKYYPAARARELLQVLRQAGLEGYVGHWDRTGLVGVYLSGQLEEDASIQPIDVNNLPSSLNRLKAKHADWQKKAFTGDYDAHDIITFRGAGRPRTVLAGSHEEKLIIDLINREVALDDNARPFAVRQYNVVRHGPQVNFWSFMVAHEKNHMSKAGGVVGAVARPGEFPVAAVRKNTWTIINNVEELALYYKSLGAVIKESWRPEGVRDFVDQSERPGIVKLGRRPSQIST
ncbi:hypothetical protein [Pseudomonas vranovensis]|uniref:hypothetical protein n=1 Tax=Pseudomonas vranovensis TaxID=321661 RepID=UPI0004903975|nr:hypothetical protein [Pseudomonas vranovensis]